jgi:hypothetical protein
MVIVDVVEVPAATVAEVGLAVRVKLAAAALATVNETVVVCAMAPEVPVMVTVDVPAGVAAVVVMVSAEVTAPVVGVTEGGTKPQVAPVGRPVQVKATALVNPFDGVTLTVEVAELPGATDAGESAVAATVKLVAVTTSETVAVSTIDPDVPVTVTVDVPAGVAAVVVMVSAEVTAAAPGVTEGGTNAQVAPAGRPVQVSATAAVNPFDGVTVTVEVAEPPGATDAGASGVSVTVKPATLLGCRKATACMTQGTAASWVAVA